MNDLFFMLQQDPSMFTNPADFQKVVTRAKELGLPVSMESKWFQCEKCGVKSLNPGVCPDTVYCKCRVKNGMKANYDDDQHPMRISSWTCSLCDEVTCANRLNHQTNLKHEEAFNEKYY